MKKVTFLAGAIALLGAASLDASAQTSSPQEQASAAQQGQEEKKEKVTQDQLPEPVKTALQGEAYKDWTIGEIHRIAPAAGDAAAVAVYEVSMTNAQGKQNTLRIDEKGAEAAK